MSDELDDALFAAAQKRATPADGDPVGDALFAAATSAAGQHPGMKRALRDYTPDIAAQDERMEGDPILSTAAKRAIATDPALSTASLLVGGAADLAGIPTGPFSPAKQAEFLAKQAPSDPGAAAELDARAMMAQGGIPGATMAGARGLAGGAETVFSVVPGIQGVGQVGKGAAAALPKMLAPAAAGALAPAIPGVSALAELPAAGGRAAARVLGAEEGGAGEALGGTLGGIAPAFGPLAFAKGAGRSMAGPGVEPAFRVGQTPLGRLGAAVAAEGGLARIVSKSPTLGYEAANIAAMLPQAHIAPEASRLASTLGASPESAELVGQLTGLGATLPIAAMESRIAASGVRQGMERVAAARAKADADAKAATEAAELRALRSHEAPQTPTPEQRDAAYLQEMYAKDAERRRALAGVAGAVEGARATEQAKVEEAFPPVPPQPPTVRPKVTPVKPTEGPGMDPVAYAEALEQGVPPSPREEAINAEARKPLEEFQAGRMRDADRAASDLANREALHDETAEKWNAMDAEERKAVASRLPPGILRGSESRRSFDRFSVEQKEHIAEAIRDPVAFADAVEAEPPAATAPVPLTLWRGVKKGRSIKDGGETGRFLAPDEKGARMYAGPDGTVESEQVSFSNLLEAKNWGGVKEALGLPVDTPMPDVFRAARARGHDGVTFTAKSGREYVDLRDVPLVVAGNTRAPADAGPPAAAPTAPPKPKWSEFLKSKGIGTVKPTDPRYAALRAEYDGLGAPKAPAPAAPAPDAPPAPPAPEAPPPKPGAPAPPKPAPKSKTQKFYETRLRSNGEVSVKGDTIRLDSSGKTYRVIVNNKEVFSGSPADAFARADQEIARADKGQMLGTGLGAVDLDNPSVRRVIRGTLGGATGYIVGVANDEPDDTPTGRAARRALWTAAGVGAATGVPGWQRFVSRPAGRLAKKVQPAWFRDYFGNPNERISETVAAIERGNLDKVEIGKTQAHIEAMRAPDLEGSQARIYQDYLRGEPKAVEAFPRLVEHIRKTNPDLADAMLEGAAVYKSGSKGRTAQELALDIRSPEAAAEYPEGHVQRVYQRDTEKPARPRGVNRGKVNMGEKAKDAPYWEGNLDPVTVELIMDEYGLPKPTGPNTYFRGTEDSGTLVKWFPDAEGEKARQDFLTALSLYAKENAVKPISAGKIVGGGDDRMVVQVGKGSRADIGHLVSTVPDKPAELLVRAPRAIANEIVKTLGLDTPKVTPAGSRLRYAFKDAGEVARFQDAVRELAVEGSTFNVTPQARSYFRNRLRGAKVKMGPGQSGGTGHLTKETGPGMNLRERREAGEVYNPKAVTYKSSYEQARRIANAEMWNDYATKSDEHGPFSIERPVDDDGVAAPLSKDGFFTAEDGTEYKFIPKDKSHREAWGALAGRGLRRDVYEFKSEQRDIEESSRGFVRGMLSKWKSLKTGTPVWAALNIPSDLAFAYAADTSPVGGPSNWKSYMSVGRDFLNYIRTGDPSHVKRHVEGPGIRFHEKMTTGNDDADAVLESLMFGAKESASAKAERRGELAMDIASLGTLAGRTAKTGAALGALGGAAAGTAVGVAEGDSWDEILKRAGKGAAIGAGANLTARSIRRTGPLIDAYFKAVAYDIMTKRQGYSHAEARARVRKFFQNYEEPSKAIRVFSGKTGNPLAGAVVNPFLSFYSELLRIGSNAVAENPIRAAAILGAIPVAASVYNHYAGTFPDAEEGRAAKANAPTGIVGRTKSGGLASMELGRVNPGADLLADIHAVVKDPAAKESYRRILTSFGGSTPILNLVDAGKTYFVPDNKDLRTGMEIRRPGESPARAAARHAMATITSPLAPEFGTTEQFVERSITKPFAAGTRGDESRPDRAITQALTGVRIKDIDFNRIAGSRQGQLQAELHDLTDAFRRAMRESNIASDPAEVERLNRQLHADYSAAIDRYRKDIAKKTPQPVGAGR